MATYESYGFASHCENGSVALSIDFRDDDITILAGDVPGRNDNMVFIP